MKKLVELLYGLPEFEKLLAAVDNGRCPVALSGLAPVHRAHFAAAVRVRTGRSVAVVCADDEEAQRMERDLAALTGEGVVRLEARPFNFLDGAVSSRDWEHRRLAAFHKLRRGQAGIVVASVEGLLQRTIPPRLFDQAAFALDPARPMTLEQTVDALVRCGYSRCDQVEGVGQFAQRGGILDFFSAAYDLPVRVEFWDTDIDSMGLFDPLSQRRVQRLERAEALPAAEVLPALGQDPEALGGDRDLPRVYAELATAVDYFPADAVVFCSESSRLAERCKRYLSRLEEDVKLLAQRGLIPDPNGRYACGEKELRDYLDNWPAVYLDAFTVSRYPVRPRTLLSVMAKQLPSFGTSLETASEDLAHYQREGYAVTVLVANEDRALSLQAMLREEKVRSGVDFALHDLPGPGHSVLAVGGLSAGFEYPALKCAVFTQNWANPAKKRRQIRDRSNRQKLASYNDLSPGDLVVHSQYGIGRFTRLTTIQVDGVDKEFMQIAYAGSDVLYVPITQLDMVSKYIGGGENDKERKLSRLGGGDWDRACGKARAAVRDLAKGLVQLYAQRQRLPGYAFSPDSPWQREFEEQFEYAETEDQLRCVTEIKRDMEQPRPMDRLLCGDVGYGKTEVAFRAIMKCILDGKQAAILVPTTVLARQHFLSAKGRFARYPVTVESLTRFNTPSQARNIMQNLKDGRIDLLVGTHRLLQKDIQFKDLGLLVVDEEQRFGVAHKERLKELSRQVDVLTLSATPIPRTLNMALSGIRDMSTLEEPPAGRQPVQTYVLEHDWSVIAGAIRREVERGGQVYYLHNRIETISRCAQRLQDLLGDGVTVAVAHGRMTQEEINATMTDMSQGNIDVLVCTTIIETGIDIPNVNTLIIENADAMGLAQLHQIRGRVGRSSRRAVAYLTYKPGKVLSDVAAKRLSAIREFAEFGSGFKIAMRDLEIRGAGNLLGPEQSGFMLSVGYDMYLQLLEEAVLEERGEPLKKPAECAADLTISAAIPDRYVPQPEQRMDLYRRIAAIRSEAEADDITDELIDRYGDPPRPVNALIAVALMRATAAQNGISEITQKGTTLSFLLSEFDPRRVSVLCGQEKYKTRVVLSAGEKPCLTLRLKKGEDALRWGTKLVEDYAKTAAEPA